MTQEVDPTTALIEIARGGGAVTLRYVSVPTVSEESNDEIREAIDRFLDDCQTMIVWYAGIEGLQDSIHQHFSETVSRDKPFTLSNLYPNGEQRVLVQVPGDMVIARIPHLAQTSDAVNRQLSCFSSRYMNLLAVFQI